MLKPVPFEIIPFPRMAVAEGFISASRVNGPVIFSDAEFGTATWLPTVPGKFPAWFQESWAIEKFELAKTNTATKLNRDLMKGFNFYSVSLVIEK